MKKSICLAVFFLVAGSFLYADVGQHNGTINVGGVFNYSEFTPNKGTEQEKKDGKREYIGGGFNASLGYLYLTQGTLIHGFDTRLTFGISWNPIHKFGGESSQDALGDGNTSRFDRKHATLGTTYLLGTRIGGGRLMMDVLGVNIGWFVARDVRTFRNGNKMHQDIYGNSFLLGLTLPLGTQYIFDNGFMVGFRHRLDFTWGENKNLIYGEDKDRTYTIPDEGSFFGTSSDQNTYLGYSITISFGFALGK